MNDIYAAPKHMFHPSYTNSPWTISDCISTVYLSSLSSVSLHHVSKNGLGRLTKVPMSRIKYPKAYLAQSRAEGEGEELGKEALHGPDKQGCYMETEQEELRV